MHPLEKRVLGRTGVEVTRLGFGGGQIGGMHRKLSELQVQQTIHDAIAAGVNYYDTAPYYGHCQSEHRLGYALRQHPRDSFVVSTKVGRVYRPAWLAADDGKYADWEDGLPFVFQFDYTYDGVMRSYEDSLHRLGMNRIDLLVIHDLDTDHHHNGDLSIAGGMDQLDAGGGFKALEELRTAGQIRGIGAGINLQEMIEQFLARFDMDFFLMAMPYSLVDQTALDESLPICVERNVSIVKGAPYASGILATGAVPDARYNYAPASPEILEKTRRIEQVCQRYGVNLRAVALQFPFGHQSFATTIPGVLSTEEIADNLRMMSVEIPSDLWHELKHEGLLRADAPTP